jgi:hypothetical protein
MVGEATLMDHPRFDAKTNLTNRKNCFTDAARLQTTSGAST